MISWTLSLINHILDELFTLLSEVMEEGLVTYDSIESKSIFSMEYVYQPADHHQSRLATPLRLL